MSEQTCPECKVKIDSLDANYQIFVTYSVELNEQGDMREFDRDEYDEELINYSCPSCSAPLFTHYEDAVQFMKGGSQ